MTMPPVGLVTFGCAIVKILYFRILTCIAFKNNNIYSRDDSLINGNSVKFDTSVTIVNYIQTPEN